MPLQIRERANERVHLVSRKSTYTLGTAAPIQAATVSVLFPSIVDIFRDKRGENWILWTVYLELKLRKHPLRTLNSQITHLL